MRVNLNPVKKIPSIAAGTSQTIFLVLGIVAVIVLLPILKGLSSAAGIVGDATRSGVGIRIIGKRDIGIGNIVVIAVQPDHD